MKILQVCPRYYPQYGGIEEHVQKISEILVRNHQVTIATTDSSRNLLKEETINGVNVLRFRSWAPGEAYYFSGELRSYLRKNSECFDLVHAHNYHAFPAYYAAESKGRNKLVFTPHYHGTGHTFLRKMLHVPYRYIGKTIFERADRIVSVSDYERGLLKKHFRIGNEKLVMIPNGIDPKEFQRPHKQSIARAKARTRTILYVGRLEKYKGIHFMIAALPKMKDNNVVFQIVGTGPFKENLAKLARKLNVEDKVKFVEDLPRSGLLDMYAEADLFVLLSKHEAYGICVMEALASGTPCIVARTSALNQWVDNENCYGISEPVNIEELANLVGSIEKRVVRELKRPDWDDITEKLSVIYENC